MCARSTRRLILAAALAILTIPSTHLVARQSATADPNPLIGRWSLLVEKSRYDPGPPPRSQLRIYEAAPKGLRTTIQTVNADGESSTVEYTTNYDSIEYRVTGSPQLDGIALTKVDPYTAQATLTHAGRIVGTAKRIVSKDGQTMTITFSDVQGVVHNVAVYEREKP